MTEEVTRPQELNEPAFTNGQTKVSHPEATHTVSENAQPKRNTDRDYQTWQVGERDPRNEDIRNICGQRTSFIVYFVKGGWLNWYYDAEKVLGAHKLEAQAQIYLNKGRSWIRSKREFGEYRNIVAAAMVHGFSNLEEQKPFDECFSDAAEYLRVRSRATYQIFFVLSAVAAAALSGGILFLLATVDYFDFTPLHKHLFLGGACGAYGALLSILIRARKVEPEFFSYDARLFVSIESTIRIALGVSFGFILVLLQKADVLLHIAGSNQYFVALGSIIAGFSERLIPSLLAELEGFYAPNRTKADDAAQSPPKP